MDMSSLTIGSAVAKPGSIQAGWFNGVLLPTGSPDRIPVIIAQGQQDGPVMWITTGIHGDEHAGMITLHTLITEDLVKNLKGTLIAVPALSPAGMQIKKRVPFTSTNDPNRQFPDIKPASGDDTPTGVTSALEDAFNRLYEAIIATSPCCLIDLHNAWIGSIPFVFRDPIFYWKGSTRGRGRRESQKLQAQVDELIAAFGFTIINEFAADSYISKDLHRSVSGAILNKGGIPSITVELGSWMHVDQNVPEACGAGLRNAMRLYGLLDGEREPIEGIPVIDAGFRVRRHMAPYVPASGVVHMLKRAGERFSKGEPLVRLVDIFGQPVGPDDGLLRSEWDGFVLGWQHGVIRYQGETVMGLAIRDDSDLIVPYPE